MRLREEGGKVRGLLEGGRAPVASWPPATNEQPGHLLLKEHFGQFKHLGNFEHFWTLLGKKKKDGLPFSSRPCGLSPCCSGDVCDRIFNQAKGAVQ